MNMNTQRIDSELKMAAEHFGPGLVTADSVPPDSAATVPPGPRTTMPSAKVYVPCSGFCSNAEAAALMMRKVGNSVEAAKAAITANLELNLDCGCKPCAEKHLVAAEALEQHAGFLRARRAGNDKEVEGFAFRRGAALRRLGYRLV